MRGLGPLQSPHGPLEVSTILAAARVAGEPARVVVVPGAGGLTPPGFPERETKAAEHPPPPGGSAAVGEPREQQSDAAGA